MMMRDKVIRFLENFLWAGGSALLIAVSHRYPKHWFVSLFALIPFLYRVGHETHAADNSRGRVPIRLRRRETRHSSLRRWFSFPDMRAPPVAFPTMNSMGATQLAV
jgi:hypothetical protein